MLPFDIGQGAAPVGVQIIIRLDNSLAAKVEAEAPHGPAYEVPTFRRFSSPPKPTKGTAQSCDAKTTPE